MLPNTVKHSRSLLLGRAVTWVRCFVKCFLRVPQLFCSFPAAQGSKGKLCTKPLAQVTARPSTEAKTDIGTGKEFIHSLPSGGFTGFVNNFLRVSLACLGSREAA